MINVPFKLKAGDKELEDKEAELGHFKKGAGSASLQEAVDKLKQGNRELGIKQMASIHDMLSSDEDSCTTNSKLSGTIGSSGSDKGSSNIAGGHVGKESNLSQLGSNIRGVTSQKKSPKKPVPLPRHPDTLPDLKNNAVQSLGTPTLMSGKTKVYSSKTKRRPPGMAKIGKSPRNGKNLRSKPPGMRKKKAPPVAK